MGRVQTDRILPTTTFSIYIHIYIYSVECHFPRHQSSLNRIVSLCESFCNFLIPDMSLHTQDPGFAVPGSHRTSQDTDSAVTFLTGLPRTSGAPTKRIGSGPPDAWNKGIFLDTLVENKFVPTPLKPKLFSSENFPILPSLGIFSKGPIGGHGESYEGSPLDPGVQRGVRPRLMYPPPLKTGTMEGTTMAATEIWKIVLERCVLLIFFTLVFSC